MKKFFFLLMIIIFNANADEEKILKSFAKKFSIKYGKNVLIIWGENKLTPKAILGLKVLEEGAEIENMAKNFLLKNKEFILYKNIDFKFHKIEKTRSASVVRFQQLYKGIEVEGKYLTVKFDNSKRIRAVHSDFDPFDDISVKPFIKEEDAIKIAIEKCTHTRVKNDEKPQIKLVILPRIDKAFLAYKVYVPTIPYIENIYCYIDAMEGQVLMRKNLVIH